ncbi:MAG: hypothetical protein NWF09_07525 [Candidatus Bathyarchaeota archaeon]|nr:hypothetical protein [Candidatus Bathyarchaeota archaeon]
MLENLRMKFYADIRSGVAKNGTYVLTLPSNAKMVITHVDRYSYTGQIKIDNDDNNVGFSCGKYEAWLIHNGVSRQLYNLTLNGQKLVVNSKLWNVVMEAINKNIPIYATVVMH